jgi:tRNA(Ile)-lysidine synthase
MTQGASPDSIWPDILCEPFRSLPDHKRLWVALSGGLDSVLLLHLTAFCRGSHAPLGAIHVNHQLQPNAVEAESFCRAQCERLGIPLVVRRVTVSTGKEASGTGGVEEAARHARYGVFEQLLEAGDVLLMAHHADDQAETVLFRLLRGSGVAGLSGMPRTRSLGAGQLVRPLLAIERADLERWGRHAGLSWVEDPSNSDQHYDRNYLRHAVLPGLKARWPGLVRRVRHTAEACSDSAFLNQRLAELQWAACSDAAGRLLVSKLLALTLAEQKNLFRWWVRKQGYREPSVSGWRQVMHDLLKAGDDREPELRGDGFSLRRYQGKLYLVPDPPELLPQSAAVAPGRPLRWNGWLLQLEQAHASATPPPAIRVSTRKGGEKVRLHPGGPAKSLKKWLQEHNVPPWERPRIPLVFAESGGVDTLLAIGDLWCCEQYSGSAPAAGWRLLVRRDSD